MILFSAGKGIFWVACRGGDEGVFWISGEGVVWFYF